MDPPAHRAQGGVRGSRNDPHLELTPVREQESEILLARELGQLAHHQNELRNLWVDVLPLPPFELGAQSCQYVCRLGAIGWVDHRPLMRKRQVAPAAYLEAPASRALHALHATRAANEEGILPGGGTAPLRAAAAIDGLALDGDQKIGAEILKRALEEPLRQLVRNAGLDGSVVVEELRRQNKPNWGFDVMSEQYCGSSRPASSIRPRSRGVRSRMLPAWRA